MRRGSPFESAAEARSRQATFRERQSVTIGIALRAALLGTNLPAARAMPRWGPSACGIPAQSEEMRLCLDGWWRARSGSGPAAAAAAARRDCAPRDGPPADAPSTAQPSPACGSELHSGPPPARSRTSEPGVR
eukprot:scaffold175_cov414-Prasinococcus_capsulatus_cf.AAC.16